MEGNEQGEERRPRKIPKLSFYDFVCQMLISWEGRDVGVVM